MNGQQAPTTGRSAVARQASRSLPDQVALKMVKSRTGGTTHASSATANTARAKLATLENTFLRSHPTRPVAESGGGSGSAGVGRT